MYQPRTATVLTLATHPACPQWCTHHVDQDHDRLTEPARFHHGASQTVVAVDRDNPSVTETIYAELYRADWCGRAGRPQVLISRLEGGVRTDIFCLPLSIADTAWLAEVLHGLLLDVQR